MKKVTIKDVAKKVGVAPSTVSFVLNNTENQTISEATRQKVLAVCKELGYSPNYMASNMRNNMSKTIGVVASYNVYRTYFLDMMVGIMDAAAKEGYGVLICETGRKNQENADYVKYFLSNRIDGVLLLSSAHSEQDAKEEEYIQSFKRYDIPFVTVYGYTNIPGACYVNIDFHQCGFDACRYLFRQGCKKVAYIAPLDKDNINRYAPKTECDKQNGYTDAVAQYGDREDATIIYLPRNFKENNYGAILKTIFDTVEHGGYDGFIACWATYGMQILSAAAALNLPVPRRFKLIALDTAQYLEFISPGLSSMQLPFFDISIRATEILIDRLLKRVETFEPESVFLPCTLLECESTFDMSEEIRVGQR